jgi:hypothetical protein
MAVRGYLMFPINYRDLELMLQDRGVEISNCPSYHHSAKPCPNLPTTASAPGSASSTLRRACGSGQHSERGDQNAARLELDVAALAKMGDASAYGPPKEFADFVNAEIEKWRGAIRREGLDLEIG